MKPDCISRVALSTRQEGVCRFSPTNELYALNSSLLSQTSRMGKTETSPSSTGSSSDLLSMIRQTALIDGSKNRYTSRNESMGREDCARSNPILILLLLTLALESMYNLDVVSFDPHLHHTGFSTASGLTRTVADSLN